MEFTLMLLPNEGQLKPLTRSQIKNTHIEKFVPVAVD